MNKLDSLRILTLRLYNFTFWVLSIILSVFLEHFFFNWRKIALWCCVGFCQITGQMSHKDTCIPSLLSTAPPIHPLFWSSLNASVKSASDTNNICDLRITQLYVMGVTELKSKALSLTFFFLKQKHIPQRWNGISSFIVVDMAPDPNSQHGILVITIIKTHIFC